MAGVRGDIQSQLSNHILVLLNGRPVRESLLGGLNFPFFSAFPVEMIERKELVRGPGSVLYGTNAYSGIVNVITRRNINSLPCAPGRTYYLGFRIDF